MTTLKYLKKRYPNGRLKASRDFLVYFELLTREEAKDLRELSKDGYVDIEHLAELIDAG